MLPAGLLVVDVDAQIVRAVGITSWAHSYDVEVVADGTTALRTLDDERLGVVDPPGRGSTLYSHSAAGVGNTDMDALPDRAAAADCQIILDHLDEIAADGGGQPDTIARRVRNIQEAVRLARTIDAFVVVW